MKKYNIYLDDSATPEGVTRFLVNAENNKVVAIQDMVYEEFIDEEELDEFEAHDDGIYTRITLMEDQNFSDIEYSEMFQLDYSFECDEDLAVDLLSERLSIISEEE